MSDRELNDLRARLALYESYDRLIQDNVARSEQLLQSMQHAQNVIAAVAPAAVDTGRSETMQSYRLLFSALLDEVTDLQGSVERLARRLQDALDELESELIPAGELATAYPEPTQTYVPPPASITAHAVVTIDKNPAQVAPAEESGGVWVGEFGAAASNPTPATEVMAPAPVEAPTEVPWQPPSRKSTRSTSKSKATLTSEEPAGLTTTVLVHGVQKPQQALSMKRHLEAIPTVSSVDPREFAEGMLRLLVVSDRLLQASDIPQWQEGGDYMSQQTAADVIEIRLPAPPDETEN